MLRIVSVNETKPSLTLLPSIQKCLDDDFVPNSTYFSNGVVIINNKTNYSYIYNHVNNNIDKCSKYNYLYNPYNNNIFTFSSIDGNIYKTNEMQDYAHNSTLSILEQQSNGYALVTIGGDTYVYGLLKQYQKYYCIGNEQYLKDAKKNMTPQNSHTIYLSVDNIDIHTNEPLDIIIGTTIDDSILNVLMSKNINQLIILDYNSNNIDLKSNSALFIDDKLNKVIQIEDVMMSSNTYESIIIAKCKLKKTYIE